jgi:hypothetical protein
VQVRVQVREHVEPLHDLWPYLTELRALLPSMWLLTLDVHDSRELVCVLIALADRGVAIEEVDVQHHAARPGAAEARRVMPIG